MPFPPPRTRPPSLPPSPLPPSLSFCFPYVGPPDGGMVCDPRLMQRFCLCLCVCLCPCLCPVSAHTPCTPCTLSHCSHTPAHTMRTHPAHTRSAHTHCVHTPARQSNTAALVASTTPHTAYYGRRQAMWKDAAGGVDGGRGVGRGWASK